MGVLANSTGESFHNVYTYQITTMYSKYLTISCQLYLNKAEKKIIF